MKKRTNLICEADYSQCVITFGSFPITKVTDWWSLVCFLQKFIEVNDFKSEKCDYPFVFSSVRSFGCSVLSFCLGVSSSLVSTTIYDTCNISRVYCTPSRFPIAVEFTCSGHRCLLTSKHLVFDFTPCENREIFDC